MQLSDSHVCLLIYEILLAVQLNDTSEGSNMTKKQKTKPTVVSLINYMLAQERKHATLWENLFWIMCDCWSDKFGSDKVLDN